MINIKKADLGKITHLTLTDSVTEHHQLLGLPSLVGLVELHQQVLSGVLHVLNDLLVIVQSPVLQRENNLIGMITIMM